MDEDYMDLMSELVACQENLTRYEERIKELKEELLRIEANRELSLDALEEIVNELRSKLLGGQEDE